MHLVRSLVASFVALGFVSAAAAAERHPFAVEDLVRLKRVSDPALSPDGKTVVYVVRETDLAANRGRQDLWSLDLATKGAQPRRLTSNPENDNSPDWSRDGRYVYFISSRGGSAQVWRLPAAGGEAEQVTSLPLDVGSFRLAPDASRIAVSLDVFADCEDLACTTARLKQAEDSKASGKIYDRAFVRHWDTWSDGRISQLFVLRIENGRAVEPRSLTVALDADVPSKPFGDASEYTFSADGSKVVFDARVKGKSEPWSTNFDLYEVSVEGGEPRNLTGDNPAWDAQPVFSPDGSMMAWRAMRRPGFEADRFHVMIKDLKSGETRELAQEWDRSADQIEFSADGKTLYAVADHFGQHPVWAIDVKTGKANMVTGPGHVDSFAVGEREIVFAVSTLKSPAELQAVTLKGGDLRELPRMNADAFAQLQIGEPEQFTFAGANGETVYGYVMRPANYNPKQRYPVAFIVHGGPQSSFANAWSYRWNPQTYAGAGYASIFIDFHGSPGYGQAFTDSISQDWGGKPLEDLQKGLQAALERFPWLDGDRMCALGASYGGYMMNWIAGNWNEPFKCIVSHAGIFDTRGMGFMTEELWFAEWENGGTPWEAPDNYEKYNPLNHVKDWKKPMLVIAGQNDYRVPYSQSLSMFNALQRQGIPSRLLIYPNENHWVLKPANSVQWHHEVEKWLNQWTAPAKGE
ncbi:MAG TPA: S9 family peptidase [Steroidobacteraceae bacterium]|nr:S9 family peptidase [Steroidobacteraceae bacterium]